MAPPAPRLLRFFTLPLPPSRSPAPSGDRRTALYVRVRFECGYTRECDSYVWLLSRVSHFLVEAAERGDCQAAVTQIASRVLCSPASFEIHEETIGRGSSRGWRCRRGEYTSSVRSIKHGSQSVAMREC
jgi:hypothetical protein